MTIIEQKPCLNWTRYGGNMRIFPWTFLSWKTHYYLKITLFSLEWY